MSLAIADWNINPNRLWLVKLSDSGALINIELYPTNADAVAGTNLVASGTAAYGTGSSSELAMDAFGTPEISLFNTALPYHIKVSGLNGDAAKIFQVLPFVDLPPVNNNIYRSQDLIQKKATSEINKHTHTAKIRSIGVANHNPDMSTDDVLSVQSTMRNLNVLATITELMIIATQDSLTDQVETIEYLDQNYG